MNSVNLTSGMGEPSVVITRVTQTQWHAMEDDRVVGRSDASRRPDGRIFVSIDSWHDAVFGQLAEAISADLPTPLYTVVDETDRHSISSWERAGFTTRRREWEYLMPTDPQVTGLDAVLPPPGVTIVSAGEAKEAPLRALDREIRDEVEATVGWQEMPAEVLALPDGNTILDPSKYVVAAQSDRYVGLVRVVPRRRHARIGLVAVRADQHRRGIARTLLAHALIALHRNGIETASADVNESNAAAMALFEGIGARRASSNLELVLR
ncbi:GNAT family N-acetyltransferase [Nocardia anaemiae]|uniref:GNAT family N-acetyltransferase n=1 Tax=Nocardia anaemiae TaxID=263910 RepID=UPI0007A52428|nr:GNAT family N-acetyltransferase [Nocardia anaemiae]